jgi:hypothetical protein
MIPTFTEFIDAVIVRALLQRLLAERVYASLRPEDADPAEAA